jgi:serine O-acetyltransferase
MSDAPQASGQSTLHDVVDAMCQPWSTGLQSVRGSNRRLLLPSRDQLIDIVQSLRSVLFPGYFSRWDLSEESLHFYVGATLDRVMQTLFEQVKRGLCFGCEQDASVHHGCDDRAQQICRTFLGRLPELRRVLAADVMAAYEGDPAATSLEEIIFSYPGLQAIIDYRLAHELYVLGTPLIPRIITEHAHSLTGVDIHPGATIGERFFIDHGTGVVIGETSVIGKNVRIYQGVTLGAKSFPLDEHGRPIKGVARHPVVEDDCIIYSGATILGRITLGRGSVIGGNVWLTRSVPAGSSVTQTQARLGLFEEGGGI